MWGALDDFSERLPGKLQRTLDRLGSDDRAFVIFQRPDQAPFNRPLIPCSLKVLEALRSTKQMPGFFHPAGASRTR